MLIGYVTQISKSTLRTITWPSQSPGLVTLSWDGRADNGMWVAPGHYTGIVAVTDSLSNTTTQHVVATIRY